MTSKPKIAARDRMLAVGVDGRELFPVENLNNPYWWTVNEGEGEWKIPHANGLNSTCLYDPTRNAICLDNIILAFI